MIKTASVRVECQSHIAVLIGIEGRIGGVVPDQGEQTSPARIVLQTEVRPAAAFGQGDTRCDRQFRIFTVFVFVTDGKPQQVLRDKSAKRRFLRPGV